MSMNQLDQITSCIGFKEGHFYDKYILNVYFMLLLTGGD